MESLDTRLGRDRSSGRGRWRRGRARGERQSVARASRARVSRAGTRLGIIVAYFGGAFGRNVRARASGDAAGDE